MENNYIDQKTLETIFNLREQFNLHRTPQNEQKFIKKEEEPLKIKTEWL